MHYAYIARQVPQPRLQSSVGTYPRGLLGSVLLVRARVATKNAAAIASARPDMIWNMRP